MCACVCHTQLIIIGLKRPPRDRGETTSSQLRLFPLVCTCLYVSVCALKWTGIKLSTLEARCSLALSPVSHDLSSIGVIPEEYICIFKLPSDQMAVPLMTHYRPVRKSPTSLSVPVCSLLMWPKNVATECLKCFNCSTLRAANLKLKRFLTVFDDIYRWLETNQSLCACVCVEWCCWYS